MTYIPRVIEPLIIQHIKNAMPPFNCILLGGVRQCGKSTLLQHLFPPEKHLHVNLAKEGGLATAIDATESFDDFTFLIESRLQYKIGGDRVMIFDEAQLSKKLGQYVRFMKEIWQKQHVILTGSTLSYLFDNTQKPTGRVIEFTLRPFNFIEFLTALQNDAIVEKLSKWTIDKPLSQTVHVETIHALEKYLIVGGLPEVVLCSKEGGDYFRILSNIFAFYKRDFEAKLSSENLTSIFNHVFMRIAASTGSPITFSSIIKSSSPGYKQLKAVLSILEEWHQIIKVECETSSLSKVGTVTPKRYIFDHGIRRLQNPARFDRIDLLDTDSSRRSEIGGIIENFVLTEYLSTNSSIKARSWGKTHQSGLLDFIFGDADNRIFGVEVKTSLSLDSKHLSSLLSYHELFPSSQLALVNLDKGRPHTTAKGTLINMIPAYAIYQFLMNR